MTRVDRSMFRTAGIVRPTEAPWCHANRSTRNRQDKPERRSRAQDPRRQCFCDNRREPLKPTTLAKTFALVAAGTLVASAASARDQIRIVGSSTVYPFTTTVAEQLGKTAGVKTPVVESTGTGGGMKLFCAGVGVEHPDATNASRRMKKGEFEDCQKNGVKDIVEITVGYDGLTRRSVQAGHPDQTDACPAFHGGGQGSAWPGRQVGRQPEQELVRHRQVAAEYQDRSAGPAADLRHARRFPRTAAGKGRRADSGDSGAEEVRRQGVRAGLEDRCAKTAPMSKPARTTT